MADDKIERQIAFIIEQQAKNTVNIARLDEELDRLKDQVSRLVEQVDRVTGAVGHLTEHMVNLKDAMLGLINVVESHDERITMLDEQSKETRARLSKIDDRLA